MSGLSPTKILDPLGLFTKDPDPVVPQPLPPPTPPAVMPTADDERIEAARRRRISEQRARSGRASTILSDRETLG